MSAFSECLKFVPWPRDREEFDEAISPLARTTRVTRRRTLAVGDATQDRSFGSQILARGPALSTVDAAGR